MGAYYAQFIEFAQKLLRHCSTLQIVTKALQFSIHSALF
jgi:hypothetical protein